MARAHRLLALESHAVPVVLRHNEQLEMSLAEYHGSVSLAELEAVATFLADTPSFLKRDTLSLVLPGADFGTIEFAALDRLFGRYKTIYGPMNFQIMRRSAWLCLSAAAQAHIDYWIAGRDTREALSSTLRQFATYAEAGDWLVLNDTEAAMLESGEGFIELARFDMPELARAAAR
jgi:hypothetical protein